MQCPYIFHLALAIHKRHFSVHMKNLGQCGVYSTNMIILARFYFGGHSPSLTSEHSLATCLFIPVITIDKKRAMMRQTVAKDKMFLFKTSHIKIETEKKKWLFHPHSSLRSRFLWQVFQSLCQSKLPITPVVSVCQIPSVTSTPSYEDLSSTQKKMGKLTHLQFPIYAVWKLLCSDLVIVNVPPLSVIPNVFPIILIISQDYKALTGSCK